MLGEKYNHHQRDLNQVFIDYEKAFDRVWHAALSETIKKYIGKNLIKVIEQLYANTSSAVLINGSLGNWFRTKVGVRQGCLLSPTLFNIFLEKIMTEALKNHTGTISINGRNITNLRFADDIVGLAGNEQELENLIIEMDSASRKHKMEISGEKTKMMTNNPAGIQQEIKVNNQGLETVSKFKYLGSIISDEGSKPEILSRIAQTMEALSRLKPLWRNNNLSIATKVRLLRALVLSIFTYACETWTLTAELERKIQALEMRCFRLILNIKYTDHITNNTVKKRIFNHIGRYEELLGIIKRRKLQWYGHITRSNGLSKTILQGTVEGSRPRGRPKKS